MMSSQGSRRPTNGSNVQQQARAQYSGPNPEQPLRGQRSGGSGEQPARGQWSTTSSEQLGSSQRSNGSTGGISSTDMNRAERFEDEKKRIIDSCFTRKEADGAYAESYITHIPVWEDATSPSAPPPLESAESNKKPRVIIVSVRRSGRVRLHKARENSNKSFSIGKTWLLDALSAIDTFTAPTLTQEDRDLKARAGDTGMLITIQKPYFWKASSRKEKEFFVGSLIKIFKKYTGGQGQLATDFGQNEALESVPPNSQRPKTPQASSTRPSPAPSPGARPPAPGLHPGPSQESFNSQLRPPSAGSSSARTIDGQDRPTMPAGFSSDRPPMPGGFPSDRSVMPGGASPITPRGLKPQDSKPRLQPTRPEPVTNLRPPSAPRDDRGTRDVDPASSTESFQNNRQEAPTPTASLMSAEKMRNNGGYSPLSRSEAPPAFPSPGPRSPERARSRRVPSDTSTNQDSLPERRRPPLQASDPAQGIPIDKVSRAAASEEIPMPLEPRRTPLNPAFTDPKRQPSSDPFGKPSPSPLVTEAAASSGNVDRVLPDAFAGLSQSPTESLPPNSPAVEEVPEANHRPGLGPMIKKKSTKDFASTIRKAAAAAGAFKPRAGGAGERLRAAALAATSAAGSDGINGVFPAPAAVKDVAKKEEPKSITSTGESNKESTPSISLPVPGTSAAQTPAEKTEVSSTKTAALSVPEERKQKRPSNHYLKYAKAVGIDPALLEGRSTEIEIVFADFGWAEDQKNNITFEDLQASVKKDLAKVETGSWLGSFQSSDERVGTVGKLLDRAIAECEELDGLLTLYNVELETLHEDVAYIEAQSQGLQVQTSNQRLLLTELQNLKQTISISPDQLRVLKEADLQHPSQLQAVEIALSQLFKAMLTIDPDLRQTGYSNMVNDDNANGVAALSTIDKQISSMRAVQEKKGVYMDQSVGFIRRLERFMENVFTECERATVEATNKNLYSGAEPHINLQRRTPARVKMWMYSPLMLFTREIEKMKWNGLIQRYQNSASKLFQDEWKQNVAAWQQQSRKTSPNEDAVFTSQEKEETGGGMSRKLTVKRTKTTRESPRIANPEKVQDGIAPWEALQGILNETCSLIASEQNFLSDMFHVSLGKVEFVDLVQSMPPEMRQGTDMDWTSLRPSGPGSDLRKDLKTFMGQMFSPVSSARYSWSSDMQAAVDWAVHQDPLQGIGAMAVLEIKIDELYGTSQDYLHDHLSEIQGRLGTKFNHYVDEQKKAIEETKVRVDKRKGIIPFIKTYPVFVSTVEDLLPADIRSGSEVRLKINDVYESINGKIFHTLENIAKDTQTLSSGLKTQNQTTDEVNEKQQLNFHIMLIQNMNHYIEGVQVRNNDVLGEWKAKAESTFDEQMEQYLKAVMSRPLGKLMGTIEYIESILEPPEGKATRLKNQDHKFKSSLKEYDAKHIKHGIEVLKKRIEKHFDVEEVHGQVHNHNLVNKVLERCQQRYLDYWARTENINTEQYNGDYEVELKEHDITSAFAKRT